MGREEVEALARPPHALDMMPAAQELASHGNGSSLNPPPSAMVPPALYKAAMADRSELEEKLALAEQASVRKDSMLRQAVTLAFSTPVGSPLPSLWT